MVVMPQETYTIEGAKFSLDDVIARLPNITRDTIIRRLRSGLRTWAELSKDPKVAALENRRRLSGGWVEIRHGQK